MSRKHIEVPNAKNVTDPWKEEKMENYKYSIDYKYLSERYDGNESLINECKNFEKGCKQFKEDVWDTAIEMVTWIDGSFKNINQLHFYTPTEMIAFAMLLKHNLIIIYDDGTLDHFAMQIIKSARINKQIKNKSAFFDPYHRHNFTQPDDRQLQNLWNGIMGIMNGASNEWDTEDRWLD